MSRSDKKKLPPRTNTPNSYKLNRPAHQLFSKSGPLQIYVKIMFDHINYDEKGMPDLISILPELEHPLNK